MSKSPINRLKARVSARLAAWRGKELPKCDIEGVGRGSPEVVRPYYTPDDQDDLSGRQLASEEFLRIMADYHGKFDRTIGPNGAAYDTGESNDMKSLGVKCENCRLHYEVPNLVTDGEGSEGKYHCSVVMGEIEKEGKCRFWVIPARKLVGDFGTD